MTKSSRSTAPRGRPARARATPADPRRRVVLDTPWMRVVAKRVALQPGAAREDYFVVEVADWAAICPRLADGRFMMIKQYRPAVGRWMLEFPSGRIEPGESAAACIRRELIEETGHRARRLMSLGTYLADTGRLSNRGHVFVADVVPVGAGWTPEPGIEPTPLTAAAIEHLVATGRLGLHQMALWLLVKARRRSRKPRG